MGPKPGAVTRVGLVLVNFDPMKDTHTGTHTHTNTHIQTHTHAHARLRKRQEERKRGREKEREKERKRKCMRVHAGMHEHACIQRARSMCVWVIEGSVREKTWVLGCARGVDEHTCEHIRRNKMNTGFIYLSICILIDT